MLKLIKIGILTAAFLTFCLPAPLVDRVQIPPVAQQPKPVLPPPGVKHLPKVEDLVLEMTNQARRSQGLAPLSNDEELRNVARAYSDDMLARNFFDHTNPEGVAFDERISDHYPHRVYVVGENIWSAFGYHPDKTQQVAKEIMDSWMNSPGHRENLLSPGYTHLGVGVSARQNKIRATQEFVGKSKSSGLGKLFTFIKARVPSSWFQVPS
ncbi:MAG: CAP domain-containing protein [Deltaproteobacteria bacterium]|nr:MAG: CAP domain-containing protein [Deltaproteobacteria bacterium]